MNHFMNQITASSLNSNMNMAQNSTSLQLNALTNLIALTQKDSHIAPKIKAEDEDVDVES